MRRLAGAGLSVVAHSALTLAGTLRTDRHATHDSAEKALDQDRERHRTHAVWAERRRQAQRYRSLTSDRR